MGIISPIFCRGSMVIDGMVSGVGLGLRVTVRVRFLLLHIMGFLLLYSRMVLHWIASVNYTVSKTNCDKVQSKIIYVLSARRQTLLATCRDELD